MTSRPAISEVSDRTDRRRSLGPAKALGCRLAARRCPHRDEIAGLHLGRIAVIAVGRHNTFGHQAPATIEAWQTDRRRISGRLPRPTPHFMPEIAAMIAATVASGCSTMLGCDPCTCVICDFARSAILSCAAGGIMLSRSPISTRTGSSSNLRPQGLLVERTRRNRTLRDGHQR